MRSATDREYWFNTYHDLMISVILRSGVHPGIVISGPPRYEGNSPGMEGFIVGPTGTFCSLFHVANIQNHPSVLSTVETYHLKFLRAPIGRWAAATGSFNNVMNGAMGIPARWYGEYPDTGPFSPPTGRDSLLWMERKRWFFTFGKATLLGQGRIRWPFGLSSSQSAQPSKSRELGWNFLTFKKGWDATK